MSNIKFWDPHPENVRLVLGNIAEQDKVLDIGGWWKPFARADYVVDYLPYNSRGGGGRIGFGPEHFNSATWYQMDICSQPLPFGDKTIDFVYCGQTLEDIRDPIRVCEEIIRVGKRGYLEVPSIWIECQYGIDAGDLTDQYPGYEKHRWLILIDEGKMIFIPKQVWLSLYKFVPDNISAKYKSVQSIWTNYLMWSDQFEFNEMIFAGREEILPILERYFDSFDYGRYLLTR